MARVNVTERAHVFRCEGEDLVGIVSHGSQDAELGVLVVVGGPQYRVGSHRGFRLLAHRLAAEGVPVMRFDYRGMGDSTGAVQSFEHTVPDIAAAIDAFVVSCPALKRVVLWSICDAVPACLLYWDATEDPRVAGMALHNPWVLSEAGYARTKIKDYYLRRLIAPDFWMKIVRGRLEVGNALRSLGETLSAARSTGGSSGKAPPEVDFRARMPAALASFPGPVLLVLSGADLTAREFVRFCGARPEWRELMDRPNVEKRELPEADHTFSTAPWQTEVEDVTLDWLRRAFDRQEGNVRHGIATSPLPAPRDDSTSPLASS